MKKQEVRRKSFRFRFIKAKNETYCFDFFTENGDLPDNVIMSLKETCESHNGNHIFFFKDEASFKKSIELVKPMKVG